MNVEWANRTNNVRYQFHAEMNLWFASLTAAAFHKPRLQSFEQNQPLSGFSPPIHVYPATGEMSCQPEPRRRRQSWSSKDAGRHTRCRPAPHTELPRNLPRLAWNFRLQGGAGQAANAVEAVVRSEVTISFRLIRNRL